MIAKISMYIIPLFIFGFWAITFLESGISKILDTEGNIGYFRSVFEKTFIRDFIVPIFWIMLVLEMLTGITALASAIFIFIDNKLFAQIAVTFFVLLCKTILGLFAGQRIAKDYQGASGIVGYIVFAGLSLIYFFGKG